MFVTSGNQAPLNELLTAWSSYFNPGSVLKLTTKPLVPGPADVKLNTVGVGVLRVSNSRTQPPSPSLFLPGGVKFLTPLLVNGEPEI
jgi:hypothetical protein